MPKTKHAFKRLAELDGEIVAEVDRRLLSGDTPSAVAHWLQEECGAFPDLKPGSVKKNLERYRSTDLKHRVMNQIAEANRGKSTSTIQKQLNAMEEMQQLVNQQKGRFEKLYLHEQSLPKGIVLKHASDEARLLKEMLVELGKLQMETGVIVRAPKRTSGQMISPTGEVTEFTWSEEQEELYQQLEGVEYAEIEIEDADEHEGA